MTIKPADMEKSCRPKTKCKFGPNKGVAFEVGDECPDGFTFNPATCDCEEGFASGVYVVKHTAVWDQRPTETLYNYFRVDEPFFNEEGKMVRSAIGHTPFGQDAPNAGACSASCQDSDGVYSPKYLTPCPATQGDGPRLDGGEGDIWVPWAQMSSHTSSLCSWVCESDPFYGAAASYYQNYGMKYYTEEEVYVTSSGLGTDLGGWMRCGGSNPDVFPPGLTVTHSYSMKYYGPGVLSYYFEGASEDSLQMASAGVPLECDGPFCEGIEDPFEEEEGNA